MGALSSSLYADLSADLKKSKNSDLLARLEREQGAAPKELLTSGQAARLLGISSINTIKNWLEAGHFPGALKTKGGHWRFPRSEVERALERMELLEEKNRGGDIVSSDVDDEEGDPEPPLL